MLARLLPVLLVLGGCPDPTAAPEGGGMSDKPMGGGAPGGDPGQAGGPGQGGPPGGPGGEGGAGAAGGPGGRPTAPGFKVTAGEGVKLSGVITYAGSKTGTVRIDFLQQSAQANFPDLVHSIELAAAGPWEVEAPKDGGEYWVVSFLDANGNGPDPGEPAARVKDLVKVGTTPITGLDLVLSDNPELGDLKPGGKDGETAPGAPGGPPGAGGAPGAGGVPGGEMKPGELPPGGAPPAGGPPGSMGAPPAAPAAVPAK
jgi:hypothetical protein